MNVLALLFAMVTYLLVLVVRTLRWIWPGWWLYWWYINRFISHDCDKNRFICTNQWLMDFGPIGRWLDV